MSQPPIAPVVFVTVRFTATVVTPLPGTPPAPVSYTVNVFAGEAGQLALGVQSVRLSLTRAG